MPDIFIHLGQWTAGAISAIGGIGVIVAALAEHFGKHISNYFLKKCEYEMEQRLAEQKAIVDKELEQLKGAIDARNHIGKVRFDAEFTIYRELSKAFFDVVKYVSDLAPLISVGFDDKDVQAECNKAKCNTAAKKMEVAQDALYCNAPFIPGRFFDTYTGILQQAQRNILMCRVALAPDNSTPLTSDDYSRTIELKDKLLNLNKLIREYLEKLDVGGR